MKGTIKQCIFYDANSTAQLHACSDADWATCPNTRRSITGFCVFPSNSLISWRAEKKTTIFISSSEAEHRALGSVCFEVQWLLYLLADLKVDHSQPMRLFFDNRLAIYIAKNLVFHERNNHLEIDCHLVREKLQKGVIALLPVRRADQVVDCFIKPLSISSFNQNINKMNLLNIYKFQLKGG